jgi:hypothetical protein
MWLPIKKTPHLEIQKLERIVITKGQTFRTKLSNIEMDLRRMIFQVLVEF